MGGLLPPLGHAWRGHHGQARAKAQCIQRAAAPSRGDEWHGPHSSGRSAHSGHKAPAPGIRPRAHRAQRRARLERDAAPACVRGRAVALHSRRKRAAARAAQTYTPGCTSCGGGSDTTVCMAAPPRRRRPGSGHALQRDDYSRYRTSQPAARRQRAAGTTLPRYMADIFKIYQQSTDMTYIRPYMADTG